MNETPENIPQSNFVAQRAGIERELRLAKEYWLRTIYPHVKGRTLRRVEFLVAQDAHRLLQAAKKKADDWNAMRAASHQPVDVDLSAENFLEPEASEMLFADNMKPEILATVAAPLVKKSRNQKTMTPDEAIHDAHELLMALTFQIRFSML